MDQYLATLLLYTAIYIFSLQWTLTHQQVNVALEGIATQSSVYGISYDGSVAIDGNREPTFSLKSCTATNWENKPWWRVDLLAVYDISDILITNRGDCCPERLDGAEILIGNSLVNNGNDNPRCDIISHIPSGATTNYTCNMIGHYVNIFLPYSNKLLTLCEVEVYGFPVPVTMRAFVKIKLISSEDLTSPTITDKILQKIKSISQRILVQPCFTEEPTMKTET